MSHPATDPSTFTHGLRALLRLHGWYSNGDGWREKSDPDRGTRPGISEGQVVDELIRRDFMLWQS